MQRKLIGSSTKRLEDYRLLKGAGLYVDDVNLPNMLHAAFLRSPYAHAKILSIDVRTSLSSPGVIDVLAASSLEGQLSKPLPPSVSPLPQYPVNYRTHYALAREKVRYVGEPVAMVIAESREAARDAIELIEVEYEPLKPVLDPERGTEPDAPLVHEDLGSNVAAEHEVRVGDYDSAASRASVIVRERFVFNRGAGHSMETRGIVAAYDARSDYLTVWDSTQGPIPTRNGLAKLLGIPESRMRVIAPDVGGGFGPKIMLFYPEEVLVPYASLKLKRPVKWVEDRREYGMCANQERVQIHYAEAAFADDGRLLGLKDEFIVDTGAYTPYGLMVPIITMCTMPGPYRLRDMYFKFRSVYTNKSIVSPVRGAGRPTAVFVMERLMDMAAKRLGIGRDAIRRINLIRPDEFPWDTGLIYQDGARTVYDSGNYPALLELLLEKIGYEKWPEMKMKFLSEGRRVGLGIALYVEGSGVGPFEVAKVRIENSGRVSVYTGVGSQGQGHYTTLAQIAAEVLGVPVELVDVVVGDTGRMDWGVGTFASRSASVAGSAVYKAALEVRRKALELAASVLEANVDDIVVEGGRVFVKGNPGNALDLSTLAALSTPLRGTLEREPGLEATAHFSPQRSTFSSGGHAAIIEFDGETFEMKIHRWVIVHDCGIMINPMIVEGQIIGGFSNGLGSAWYEEIVYDDEGHPLAITFADYLLPSSAETPPEVEVYHIETPSPLNPLGVKGVGEAGVIPVAAVIASAIEDAFSDVGVTVRESPMNPEKLYRLVRKG